MSENLYTNEQMEWFAQQYVPILELVHRLQAISEQERKQWQ
jgi:hypothetical protein